MEGSDLHLCHVTSVFLPSFFQDGLKTADKLKQYIEKLAADLYNVSPPPHPPRPLTLWSGGDVGSC